MAKKVLKFLFFFFLSTQIYLFATPARVNFQSIPTIIQEFLHYHVEHKELSLTLVQRTFEIFIQQVDPEKILLLDEEIASYLNLSKNHAEQIAIKMKKGDFSDFLELQNIIQKAWQRQEKIRGQIKNHIPELKEFEEYPSYAKFAKDRKTLASRQRKHFEVFACFLNKRTPLTTKDKLIKAFYLWEKKLGRVAKPYLQRPEDGLALLILKAFAKSLDAHTAIFDEFEAMDMRTALEKQFEGVGVVLSEGIDGIFILDVIANTPAKENGKIAINDVLCQIDKKDLNLVVFDDVLKMMRGNGKTITLGLKRRLPNQEQLGALFEVTLERRAITMDEDRLSYSFEPVEDGNLGKIILKSFYENQNGVSSEQDLKEAIQNLRKMGTLKGLVLDLRENAGGFLSQAIKVAGVFLSSGVVAMTKYSNDEFRYLRTVSNRPFYSGPLILMTSKLSASAAEVVAQSLQDYGVALIVGENTFGKGTVQFQTVTDPNAPLFFKITVGRYYSVSGKTPQIEGVVADILVPTDFSSYLIGERYLQYPLAPDEVPAAYHDSLVDLDSKAKLWCQKNYLPYLQSYITDWRKMLPLLKESSQQRLANYSLKQEPVKDFRLFKENQSIAKEDLVMKEAILILKEMIYIKNQIKNGDTALLKNNPDK